MTSMKITIDRAVVEQALEALEMSRRFVYADNRPQCDGAIDSLRAALAQQDEATGKSFLQVAPVQEPVATVAENATTQQRVADYRRGYWDGFNIGKREGRIEAEDGLEKFGRAIERAHGIKE